MGRIVHFCIGMGHDLSLMGRVMLFEFLVFWDGDVICLPVLSFDCHIPNLCEVVDMILPQLIV
jgi:hypothetical protein